MASWWDELSVMTAALRSVDATPSTPPTPATGAIVVFSSSELIGDGLIALLPREWRDRIALARDLAGLERLLDGPPARRGRRGGASR